MKNFSASLLAFLNANPACGRADLFSIALPNGQTLRATSCQVDLVYSGNTYYASQNGAWQRGRIISEASFDLHGNDMPLTVLAPYSVLYPNAGVTLMAAALMGLFDRAAVTVYTAYFPQGITNSAAINAFIASVGVENKFAGYIKPQGSISRSKIDFQVADPLYILDQKLPRNLLQANCLHTLYDMDEFLLYGTRTNCTLNPASFSVSNSVAASSTRQLINLGTTVSQAPPYYSQGFITMTSGFNNGFTFSIKQQNSTSQILLARAMPLPLAIGDTFTMFAGCDKTQATCNGRFSNLSHYRGTDYVPNPEVAI